MVRYQTQVVLRRTSPPTPLLPVGVTLDNTYYPGNPAVATGKLTLTQGLAALAPLPTVDAPDPVRAAAIANPDARNAWKGMRRPWPTEGQTQ